MMVNSLVGQSNCRYTPFELSAMSGGGSMGTEELSLSLCLFGIRKDMSWNKNKHY